MQDILVKHTTYDNRHNFQFDYLITLKFY
jgi:hypothetical protein